MKTSTEPDKLIEEVEELLAKATPGPWKTFMQSGPLVLATPGGHRIYSAGASASDKAHHEDDVNLVVRARNELLRRLLEEVKTLRTQVLPLRQRERKQLVTVIEIRGCDKCDLCEDHA